MNQLLWYYADLERIRCEQLKEFRQQDILNSSNNSTAGVFLNEREPEGCILWRRFSK